MKHGGVPIKPAGQNEFGEACARIKCAPIGQRRDAFPAVISQHATELGEEASHLGIDIQHVDGTMNALERNALMRWLKDGPSEDDGPSATARPQE